MSAAQPPSLCPRCGYDVSGPIPTWTDSGACPLEGTCTECGLAFEWVDIFRPERLYPRWSVEHPKARFPWTWLGTIGVLLRARKLWTGLSMAAPIRGWRLILMALSLLLALHLAAGAANCWQYQDYMFVPFALLPVGAPARSEIIWSRVVDAFVFAFSASDFRGRPVGPIGLLLLVWGALIAPAYLALFDTRRRAKVRLGHLARGLAYFLPVLSVVLVVNYLSSFANNAWDTWNRDPDLWTAWEWLPYLGLLLCARWFTRWWWQYTNRYLRLPRPKIALAFMLTISLLASLCACLLGHQDLRYLVGGWLLANFK